jgi:hypothetical protein
MAVDSNGDVLVVESGIGVISLLRDASTSSATRYVLVQLSGLNHGYKTNSLI